VNLPIAELLAADGTFRDPAEIRAAFAAVGLGVDSAAGTAAASCGSGVTACQLILAGRVAGIDLALFPGSYSQWCAAGRQVAVGSA
jgi:thiosulfate/3-mercaptopyruvate sulfurtransferase